MLFIYTQTKFCSELVLIYGCAALCVRSLGNIGFIGCARPRVLALAVPPPPFPELLGSAVTSLGWGDLAVHPDLVCACPCFTPGQQGGAGGFPRYLLRKGGESRGREQE